MAGYGDDSGFTEWLAENGYTLPAGAPLPAVLRNRGSQYLDAVYGSRLNCSSPTGGVEQERAWPRTGHMSPVAIPPDVIPKAWVTASYQAAWREAETPGWATSSRDPSRMTKREKADVLEREFFTAEEGGGSAGVAGANIDGLIEGLVLPFLCPETDGIGIGIWSVGR